jgi:hypothetical protein
MMTCKSRDLKGTVDRFLVSVRGTPGENLPPEQGLPEIELFGT